MARDRYITTATARVERAPRRSEGEMLREIKETLEVPDELRKRLGPEGAIVITWDDDGTLYIRGRHCKRWF